MFSFTRSRSRLQVENSRSRSRTSWSIFPQSKTTASQSSHSLKQQLVNLPAVSYSSQSIFPQSNTEASQFSHSLILGSVNLLTFQYCVLQVVNLPLVQYCGEVTSASHHGLVLQGIKLPTVQYQYSLVLCGDSISLKGTVQRDFQSPVFFIIRTYSTWAGPLTNELKYFRFWFRIFRVNLIFQSPRV